MEKDQYFSKLDLSKGYWQIPVRKEDIPKTAFVTMDCHYEFMRIPFGVMNSGTTLTRAVKTVLHGMDNIVDYIDDLLVHTETWRLWLNFLGAFERPTSLSDQLNAFLDRQRLTFRTSLGPRHDQSPG
ncbi:zinc finger protein [Elysia marginata]|uniref:Zinc finger protein n=1 Tax=Elysia marginata TaxID=1093978 RepID=A0AAV4GVV3_9GAST|nr:zinc finger protein [Elysia marginata]